MKKLLILFLTLCASSALYSMELERRPLKHQPYVQKAPNREHASNNTQQRKNTGLHKQQERKKITSAQPLPAGKELSTLTLLTLLFFNKL